MSRSTHRPPGRSAVSVKDVAAAAGVSLGTVSNVLNRPDRVSATTRAKVTAAMHELGFVRNESARQLRAGTSRTLAYVMLDAGNPFFTDVAAGIEAAAEQAELTTVLCNSANRADREEAHLALLEQQRVQGVLVTPVDPESDALDALSSRGTPVVVVDRIRAGREFCSVAVDDVHGGRLAVEHLLDRGHRRVAFVGGPDTLGQVLDGLARSKRPTAAFCANDLVALGLLQHAIRAGRRVPEDLAIVGYDDIEFAGAAAVPLTSVRQPRQELGRRAADLLLDEAAGGPHEHQQVLFTPELVARESTRA